ncbi:hypothetical protein [Falsigemmobacter faecalis]|uniref:Uncharacterized protein n=1 Tax=Falsigemmobacter faecalis TaxID=2488730 RepID=A0A3P3D6R6_9RHOB|nr:hypothetical protein [Falsigemmobacter faecalis]RRH70047.1 hypothetical protein EG244_17715 [Falsigemmobacter faecalis]
MTSFAAGPHLISAVFRGAEPLWLWTPQSLPTAFRSGGFTPPPFSPRQILSNGAAGFWADIRSARL